MGIPEGITPPVLTTPATRRIDRGLSALQRFFQTEAASTRLLLIATALALLWANSPWAGSYFGMWGAHLELRLENWSLDYDLQHWVNDGLMAIFFVLVGLEIKRELLLGELKSPRQAALPIVAAVGGMIVPAICYSLLNFGGPSSHGWGIPMATDIAFALAVTTALGDRVPFSLKVFLTALAIVDDLGAVLVIAIFYTSDISLRALLIAALLLGVLVFANRSGVRSLWVYCGVGALVWLAMLQSGVHATVAGVLVAMTVPARNRPDLRSYFADTRARLSEIEAAGIDPNDAEAVTQYAIEQIESASEQLETPLQRLVHRLEKPVAFAIVPLFALANAGVSFLGEAPPRIDRVSIGVFLGLVLGKQVGIFLASWLAVRGGAATLPAGVKWIQLWGVAILGGIGFTMSLFVAELAFDTAQELSSAKLGIFIGSATACAIGWIVLSALGKRAARDPGMAVDARI